MAASIWARKYTALGVDCTVALGTDLDDCAVGPTPYVAPDGRLVHVDLDATVFNRNVPAALGVVADVGGFADELCTVWVQNGYRHERVSPLVRALKRGPAFDAPEFRADDSVQITPLSSPLAWILASESPGNSPWVARAVISVAPASR